MESEELIRKLQEIRAKVCDNSERFDKNLEELALARPDNQETGSSKPTGHLIKLFNEVRRRIDTVANVEFEQLRSQFNKLESKKAEIEAMEANLKALEATLINNKTDGGEVLSERQSSELQRLKNSVKTYKLLTSTTFTRFEPTLEGYIQRHNFEAYETFSFNPSIMSPGEMSENFWNRLENVASINCDAMADEILACNN